MKKSYHHGDLKNVLVADSIVHLSDVGVEHFSLRKVAVSSGVTPSAVYAHYKDKAALLNAVGKYAYEKFSESLLLALKGSDPKRALDYAKSYVNFALDHETLFNLIFSPYFKLKEHESLQSLTAEINDAHKQALLDIGAPVSRIDRLFIACQGRIHGLANLIVNNQMPCVDKHDRDAVLDLMVDTSMVNID